MRPLRPTFLSSKVFTHNRISPALAHLTNRRKLNSSAPLRQKRYHSVMPDLMRSDEAAEGDRLAHATQKGTEKLTDRDAGHEDMPKQNAQGEEKLPKLSMADFRTYNAMAEHMEYFHNHFRTSWTLLYNACVQNRRPTHLSLRQFIATGLQLISHLSTHHAIEEQHIFPTLAAKMPEFRAGRNAAELLRQHQEIHRGMDVLEDYLRKCQSGEIEFQLSVLKTKMDSWGEVLWKHLDQEVKTLGAENMRKYWTLKDMSRMPM